MKTIPNTWQLFGQHTFFSLLISSFCFSFNVLSVDFLLCCSVGHKTVTSPWQTWQGSKITVLTAKTNVIHHGDSGCLGPCKSQTLSALLLLGCNTSYQPSTELIQATLYCQGDNCGPTQAQGMCALLRKGVKQLVFGWPTSQTWHC